jgi:hypothetical protein
MCALAVVALAVWFLCAWANQPRNPHVSVTQGAGWFSAAGAEQALARVLGPERPHPVGTPENAAVRGRILQELAALHVPARTCAAFTCNAWRGFSFVACATVTDIIADAVPGQGKAIVMMAHYDSVPAGPGASDDLSSVATILETVRALKASAGASRHPIVALFTDGEEAGLLGANAFLENPALKARVGAVVNVEARGTSGQSLLFQTSAGDARLIDLYAAQVPQYATSSLYAEIYKFLPNDTDLTLFLRDGFPAYNFAFTDNVRYYHSPRDTRANLDPTSLQMQGDNLLGVVRGLERTDFAALKDGNAVYLSVFGRWLPRIPAGWALPLSILVFMAIAFAAWLAGDRAPKRRGMLRSAFMPLVLLVGSVLLGFALAFLAQVISGMPDPAYAYPLAMRLALGIGVWGMVLLVSRIAGPHGAATSAWLWMSGLAAVTAATLAGLSPYFLFPSLVAAVLLLATARLRGGWSAPWGQAALFVSALAALVIWLQLVVSGEGLMGLKLHPLFTIPAAFGLMTLVPLIATQRLRDRLWANSAAACLIAAVVGAAVAGLLPSYSIASPQRVNLIYFESGNRPARWIAETAWKATATEPIPAQLKNAGRFHFDPDAYSGLGLGSAYVVDAGAGAPRYPLPKATITNDRKVGTTRVVSLLLRGSPETDTMSLRIPKDARLRSIRVRGDNVPFTPDWSGNSLLICNGRDCRDLAVTLTLGNSGAIVLPVAERRYGLPSFGASLAAARPATAMPSQSGDGVILANVLQLRGR